REEDLRHPALTDAAEDLQTVQSSRGGRGLTDADAAGPVLLDGGTEQVLGEGPPGELVEAQRVLGRHLEAASGELEQLEGAGLRVPPTPLALLHDQGLGARL